MRESLRTTARIEYDLVRARVRASLRRAGGTAPIVLNSLPKSGTHLLIKLLEELPGISRVRLQLAPRLQPRFAACPGERTVDLGVVWPSPVSRQKVERAIRTLPSGAFITAHVPHAPDLAEMMQASGIRMVVLTRDPRDVAVSGARYLASEAGHRLHGPFAAMSEVERLMAAIVGVPPEADGRGMRDLRSRVTSMTGWGHEPFAHLTRYEDLVGPAGGGSLAAQRKAIVGIAQHLGVPVMPSEVDRIAGVVYGGTPTFRKGRAGAWRDHLGPEHLSAAGPLLEDLLIEQGYEQDGAWWH